MAGLLLITGDLATGKSAFSELLSKRYQVSVFTKDSIKEVLGDTIGFTNRDENLKLSKATVKLMQYLFTSFCKVNQSLILEANFHQEELEQFHKIAEEHQYRVLTVVLRGELSILHKRYLHRIQEEQRHPVHLSASLDEFSDFCEYIERARKETTPGDVIQVEADNFSYKSDVELLTKLDRFMRMESQ